MSGAGATLLRPVPAPPLPEQPPAPARPPLRAEWLPRLRPVLVLLAIFNLAAAVPGFLPGQVFALGFLLVIPGALLLALAPDTPESGWLRLATSVAGSVLLLMLTALALSWILPAFGVARPLERIYVLVAANLLVAVLAPVAAVRGEPVDRLLGPARPSPGKAMRIAGLGLLPLSGFAGAQLLNNQVTGGVAVFAAGAAGTALLGLVWLSRSRPDWLVATGLWNVALCMLWAYSLRGSGVFGFDIQQELQSFAATAGAGRWLVPPDGDAYASMASITALPALLSSLTGVAGAGLYKVVYPMLFALVPGVVFVLGRRWLPAAAACAAAAYFVVLPQFSEQMIALARQEVAMLFVVSMVAFAFDPTLRPGSRRAGVVLAGSGVAISHYTTAYLVSGLLIGTWLLYLLLRVVRSRHRSTPRPRAVLSLGVVAAVVGATVLWNVVITRSSSNASGFFEAISTQGFDLLPQAAGGNPLARWLNGNAPETISASEYYRRSDLILRASSPWINRYPEPVAAAYPPRQAEYPESEGDATLREGLRMASTAAGQLFLLLTVAGLGLLLLRRRTAAHRPVDLELAVMGLGMLGFVALMRVSGVAALAFNPERAQLISLTVLSVAFGAAAARLLARRPKLALTGLSVGLAAIFVQASGLSVELAGGNPTANLSQEGTGVERFAITEQERAAGRWLAGAVAESPLVFADRFGRLRLLGSSPAFRRAVVDSLTPVTLDRGAWVLGRDANLRHGRAEGSIGNDFAVYGFPKQFLDDHKNVVFSAGSTRIWK